MSGGEFSVAMSDLQNASNTFSIQARKLRGLIPAGGPACPDAGGGDIDGAMHAVLGSIGQLNAALAGAMASHGQKLAQAHANYSRTEMSLTRLSEDLLATLAPGSQRR